VIDPLDSLTFSLHSNQGAYALLLGSGVSRAARIPTGWEVVEDLIRRLAAVRHEDCEPDPAAWFEKTSGRAPTYSALLGELAPLPLERQQLLRGYFEPSSAERERRLKLPTGAHRAVARLVAGGYVRVVLTTNFDRLLEQALEELGIVPIVISSPDQIAGMPALLQIRCLLVKLHGDYLDARIKNTPEELARYDKKLDRLLDRLLEEFGLIVCGWSAQWDAALRAALARCPSRRFTTYWAFRGRLEPEAEGLIALRRAQSLKVADADTFFETLAGRLEALARYDRPHPLSVRLAVETLKSYLVDPRNRIRLADLLRDETESAVAQLFAADRFPLVGVPFDSKQIVERMQAYEGILERLQALLAICAAWAEPGQQEVWLKIVARIASPPRHAGAILIGWDKLRRYPALRLLYAGGIAAITAGRLDNLRALMEVPALASDPNKRRPLVLAINSFAVVDQDLLNSALGRTDKLPMSEYLYTGLRANLQDHLPADADYEQAFNRFEYLLALTFLDLEQEGWCPPGRFIYNLLHNRDNVVDMFRHEATQSGASWPPLQAGLFGGLVERFDAADQALRAYLRQNPRLLL
jgi:hypothetical protein